MATGKPSYKPTTMTISTSPGAGLYHPKELYRLAAAFKLYGTPDEKAEAPGLPGVYAQPVPGRLITEIEIQTNEFIRARGRPENRAAMRAAINAEGDRLRMTARGRESRTSGVSTSETQQVLGGIAGAAIGYASIAIDPPGVRSRRERGWRVLALAMAGMGAAVGWTLATLTQKHEVIRK